MQLTSHWKKNDVTNTSKPIDINPSIYLSISKARRCKMCTRQSDNDAHYARALRTTRLNPTLVILEHEMKATTQLRKRKTINWESKPSNERKKEIVFLQGSALTSRWGYDAKSIVEGSLLCPIAQLVIEYADTVGFQKILNWKPTFNECRLSEGHSNANKFLICSQDVRSLKNAHIFMLHRCNGMIYSWNLTGSECKRVSIKRSKSSKSSKSPKLSELSRRPAQLHQLSSDRFIWSPINGFSRKTNVPPAILFDATRRNLGPLRQNLEGEVVVATDKSYIVLARNSVRFLWRTKLDQIEISEYSKPYLQLCFGSESGADLCVRPCYSTALDFWFQSICFAMNVGDGKLFVFFEDGGIWMAQFSLEDIENSERRSAIYKPNKDRCFYKGVPLKVPVHASSFFYLAGDTFLLGVDAPRELPGLYLWDMPSQSVIRKFTESVSDIKMIGKVIMLLSRGEFVCLA